MTASPSSSLSGAVRLSSAVRLCLPLAVVHIPVLLSRGLQPPHLGRRQRHPDGDLDLPGGLRRLVLSIWLDRTDRRTLRRACSSPRLFRIAHDLSSDQVGTIADSAVKASLCRYVACSWPTHRSWTLMPSAAPPANARCQLSRTDRDGGSKPAPPEA